MVHLIGPYLIGFPITRAREGFIRDLGIETPDMTIPDMTQTPESLATVQCLDPVLAKYGPF